MSIKKYFLLLPMILPMVSTADNKKQNDEVLSEEFLLFLADSLQDDGESVDKLDMLELDNQPLVQDDSTKHPIENQTDEIKIKDSNKMPIIQQNHTTQLPKENK